MSRFVQRRDRRIIALSHARTLSVCLLATSTLVACTEQIRLGLDDIPADDVPGGSGAEAGASGSPGASGVAGASGGEFPLSGGGGSLAGDPPGTLQDAGPCVPLPCRGSLRQCGDCSDNDRDGRVDASDPECLGACDDSESEFQSGVVNVNGSCRADCYFDLNTGGGDDRCGWSYRCDPLSIAPDFDPTGSAMCQHDPALASCDGGELGLCLETCLPLTPNGCDCFGCCELPAASGRFVWLGAGDGDRPCTPVSGCQNPCGDCELCVGKTALSASCAGALGPSCPDGVRACDPQSLTGCGRLEYCITGCCVPLPT